MWGIFDLPKAQDRLRGHAKSFDSLLSLIPAKLYYSEDNSNQWQRKKQTKEQKKAARLAKFDPDNAKSAKDVMEERERKRKREEEDESSGVEGIENEKPGEGLAALKPSTKKQKRTEGKQGPEGAVEALVHDPSTTKAEKQRAKRERRKAQKQKESAKKQARKEAQKARKEEHKAAASKGNPSEEAELGGTDVDGADDWTEPVDVGAAASPADMPDTAESPASPVSKTHSPTFDPPNDASGTSSISSIVNHAPPITEAESSKPSDQTLTEPAPTEAPKQSQDELRERLLNRIAELRLARKADNEDGTPVRTRAELLEQRRQKAERKAARKKQLRQQAKEEEARQRATALAHGSPLLSPSGEPPPPPEEDEPVSTNFSFGRVAFDDGAALATHDLSGLLNKGKRRGPSDPKSALAAAQARQQRLAGLDPAKRAEVEEKDVWLNARKRAQGERLRDDPALLKKTVKRKEGKKRKSEREWQERLEGVQKGREARQAKRDQNLKTKKDRGKNGKKDGGGKGKGGGKKKPRPGFEGSFKTGGKRT